MTDTEPTVDLGLVQWAADRDEENRHDLALALGWGLPEDPADEMTETPTWAEIIAAVKAMREQRTAVAPEVVADALEVNRPWHVMDGMWTPDRILEMLAEHGLKVVRE